MAFTRLRSLASLLAALLAFPFPASAFDTPLSDTAVREAYFLGQRGDETMSHFLGKYTMYLAPPKSGPHVAAITMFTPYALAILESREHSVGYSAQQAALDHANHAETVKAVLDMLFTDTYGAYIPRPAGSRPDATPGLMPRPYDFWKDFQVNFFFKDDQLKPISSLGQPKLACGDGGCTLIGATLEFEFLAENVPSDSITIQVTPPEGEEVVFEFDLATLR
ncbi:MAG TPA: hypothetical protein VFB10_08520 [Candidatus Dormibacteraeota bacterium]|nr:hypothetical protein [Candidatus Dormibacteraeota bacterium]